MLIIMVRSLSPQSMLAKKLTEVQQEQSRVAIEEGADQEDAGVRQHDLMKWYLDTQTKRWVGDAGGGGRLRGSHPLRLAGQGAWCGIDAHDRKEAGRRHISVARIE